MMENGKRSLESMMSSISNRIGSLLSLDDITVERSLVYTLITATIILLGVFNYVPKSFCKELTCEQRAALGCIPCPDEVPPVVREEGE